MIKSLTSTFRSHENTRLEFSPCVNIIIGPSDSGKSNIVRTMNWIISNRPLGENVIPIGKELAEAQMIVERDKSQIGVTRRKGKSVNEYVLNISGEDIPFSSFGTSPPLPVLEALNLSDINVQKQNEQYFLVFDSPGQVATYIRFITGLDKVDQVVKLLAGKIRTEKGAIASFQNVLQETTKELDELSRIDLDGLDERIKKTYSLIKSNEKLKLQYQELSTLLSELETVEAHMINLPEDVDQILQDYVEIIESYSKIYDKKIVLTQLLDELELIEQQKIILPEDLEVFDTNIIIQEYNNICSRREELLDLIGKLEDIEVKSGETKSQYTLLIEEEKQLMSQLDTCPFCDSDLNEESKKFLVKKQLRR